MHCRASYGNRPRSDSSFAGPMSLLHCDKVAFWSCNLARRTKRIYMLGQTLQRRFNLSSTALPFMPPPENGSGEAQTYIEQAYSATRRALN
jgi:hypothetical protein